MATSRTGTGRWKKLRQETINEAIKNNIFNCPSCRVTLDYEYSQRPNSAEVDHIQSIATGGKDEKENLQVLCRLCNQTKSGGQKPKREPAKRIETQTRVPW